MKKLRVTVNGTPYEVEVEILEDTDRGKGYGFPSARPPADAPLPPARASVSSEVKRPPSSNDKELTSPIAGSVVEIKVKPGDRVSENDLLLVIEAMKMNTHICSPVSGEIERVDVEPKQGVIQGQVLVTFV